MRNTSAIPLAIAGVLAAAAASGAEPPKGPSSTRPAYVTPTANGWTAISLITTGDRAERNGYRMAGIPDGLGVIGGAYSPSLGTYTLEDKFITVFMNHEFETTEGIARAHGQPGAFVSQWTIDLDTFRVVDGEDLINRVYTWNTANKTYQDATGSVAFERLCSGDLPKFTAFYDSASDKGFSGRLYMNGEEAGLEGRAFAHVITGDQKGTSYQLPYLGRFSWENIVAHPNAGEKTVVVGLDDSTPGQVYLYLGDKQQRGNPVERAGLHDGKLYGIKVVNGGPNYDGGPVDLEDAGAISGRFQLANVTQFSTRTGEVLQAKSEEAGVTQFARPEDGHWDPTDRNVFYFVTTGANGQTSRLYQLRFDSLTGPAGGSIDLVIDSSDLVGKDGQVARSFDNLTVDADGYVLVQEDPGDDPYLAKTWKINPDRPHHAVQIFKSNPAFFGPGSPRLRTVNEESSGIIEVTGFVRQASWFEAGKRYYLGDMQDHSETVNPELVEGGQLYLIAGPRAPARSGASAVE